MGSDFGTYRALQGLCEDALEVVDASQTAQGFPATGNQLTETL